MFIFKRLLKRKLPEETPEERAALERAAGHISEFFESINQNCVREFIKWFCPWVEYDSLSEKDKKLFAKLSAMTYVFVMGWGSVTSNPLDSEEFKDLIPKPTPEELDAYINSLMNSGDEMEEFSAINNPEQVSEPTPQ